MNSLSGRDEPDWGERGSATVFFLIATTAAVLALGVLVDVGEALAAKATAVEQAQQAARTGAQQLSTNSLRAGELVIDPTRATAAAVAFLHDQGDTGSASVHGREVTVHVRHVERNHILGILGLGEFTATGIGTAAAMPGVAAPGDISAPRPHSSGGARP